MKKNNVILCAYVVFTSLSLNVLASMQPNIHEKISKRNFQDIRPTEILDAYKVNPNFFNQFDKFTMEELSKKINPAEEKNKAFWDGPRKSEILAARKALADAEEKYQQLRNSEKLKRLADMDLYEQNLKRKREELERQNTRYKQLKQESDRFVPEPREGYYISEQVKARMAPRLKPGEQIDSNSQAYKDIQHEILYETKLEEMKESEMNLAQRRAGLERDVDMALSRNIALKQQEFGHGYGYHG